MFKSGDSCAVLLECVLMLMTSTTETGVSWWLSGCLRFVIVVLPDHTHLLFLNLKILKMSQLFARCYIRKVLLTKLIMSPMFLFAKTLCTAMTLGRR